MNKRLIAIADKTISDSLDYNQFKAPNPATKHENDKSLQSIL